MKKLQQDTTYPYKKTRPVKARVHVVEDALSVGVRSLTAVLLYKILQYLLHLEIGEIKVCRNMVKVVQHCREMDKEGGLQFNLGS